jgi:Flp pilus assembly protein TadG
MGIPTLLRGVDGSRSSGQALVEFALVFPLIAAFVLTIFDFGRAAYAYSTVANAARAGARVAAVTQVVTSPDCNDRRPIEDPADPHWSIATCAAAAATSLDISPSSVSVSFTAPAGSALSCSPVVNVGCIANVTVHYAYTPITPIVSAIFPSITMDSTSQMPVERVFP